MKKSPLLRATDRSHTYVCTIHDDQSQVWLRSFGNSITSDTSHLATVEAKERVKLIDRSHGAMKGRRGQVHLAIPRPHKLMASLDEGLSETACSISVAIVLRAVLSLRVKA